MRLGNGVELIPEIRGRFVIDLLHDPRAFSARFLTDPTASGFAVTGLQPQRTGRLFGASLTVRLPPQMVARASCAAEVRGSDVSQYIKGGFSVRC